MKNTRPVTVSNAEILRALEERTAGADDARADRLVALQSVSTVRNQILRREVERLTQKHGANHSLVASTDSRLQASSNLLRALRFEIERTSLTSPKPAHDAWTVFGIVRGTDCTPLAGVSVVVVDTNGDVIAPKKRVPTGKEGAFSIALPLAQHNAAEVEEAEKDQADSVHLEVFKGNRHVSVDTIQFRPTAAVVDYREIVVGSPTRGR